MTKQIESVPESISREDYLSWFKNCGFEPSNVVSLKFVGKGVYAKVFERDENGNRLIENSGECVVNSVFIPVHPYHSK